MKKELDLPIAGIVPTSFGEAVILWREADFPKVCHIYLPYGPGAQMPDLNVCLIEKRNLPPLAEKIRRHFDGERVKFDIGEIDLTGVPPFHWTVYLAVHKIPYGRVLTYGQVAKAVHNPAAARAVGQAMANNPFPLVVPCHRVIRGDGTLGGFAVGPHAKRRMLELERVGFIGENRVDPAFIG